MSRYTFICEHLNYGTGEETVQSKHTTDFRADDLTSLLDNFELFLRGSGFTLNGYLAIEPFPESFSDDEEDEYMVDEGESQELKENSAWSWTVNELQLSQQLKDEKQMQLNLEDENFYHGKCEICNLDKQMMMRYDCFDLNCPVHSKKFVAQ